MGILMKLIINLENLVLHVLLGHGGENAKISLWDLQYFKL